MLIPSVSFTNEFSPSRGLKKKKSSVDSVMPSPLIQHYLPMAFACPLVSMCTTAANELYTIVLLSCVLYCTINHKVRSLPVCLFLLNLVKVNLTSMLAQPTEAIFHRIIMIHGQEKSSKFQKHNRLALQITSQHVR